MSLVVFMPNITTNHAITYTNIASHDRTVIKIRQRSFSKYTIHKIHWNSEQWHGNSQGILHIILDAEWLWSLVTGVRNLSELGSIYSHENGQTDLKLDSLNFLTLITKLQSHSEAIRQPFSILENIPLLTWETCKLHSVLHQLGARTALGGGGEGVGVCSDIYLSFLPYQFSTFQDVGSWQPSQLSPIIS